ncbi:MAG: hypothetical protein DWQ04_12610 [Chloroflexi bacterium]|nr:MAG: hypothetical protein DWQ04_12610 [Chloroflexota bacterium]
MSTTNEFFGLPMPVFTAFGWAGEETALKFALSQLELFINALHAKLPKPIQTKLPNHGLSEANQNVYLAANKDVEKNVHIVFNARPMSLELQVALTDKQALTKAWKLAEKQPVIWHRLITELGSDWSLRLQQIQLDAESGNEVGHYQDLFKDDVIKMDEDTAFSILEKATYLNSEEKWVTPLYISRRFQSEQASAMGNAITTVMSEQISELMPLINFLTGKAKRKTTPRKKAKTSTVSASVASGKTFEEVVIPTVEEGFSHISELKPLHLRKGFVNLTPKHWPYFSINSRTETRKVTVYYEGVYDKNCAVWRLVPDDRARLVLSPTVHQWLEDNFVTTDQIQVVARKLDGDEIQISLKPVR